MSDHQQPCPMCGSENIAPPRIHDGFAWVECLKCGTRGPSRKKREESAMAWNTRVDVGQFRDVVTAVQARDMEIDKLKDRLAEANEYARKLNLKLTDLCAERDAAKARNQRLMDAGGRLFEELDDKTPEPNCRCHVFPPCSDCTNHASSREALAEWKEAITESTQKAVVRSVEEINGGMGPDYAEIYLATGHVIQVNDEGLLLWPSVAAYESGENCQILGSIAFDSKEANK